MNIQVDSITEVKKKLTITVDETSVQAQMDEAYAHLQKTANIPGFRKGKTPRNLLEKRFGSSLESEVFQEIMRDSMTQALKEKELDAITIFDVTKPERKDGKGLTYSASVEVRPNIELKNYKGVKVKANKETVQEEAITDVLNRLLDNQAVMKPLEAETASKGQYASVIFERLDKDHNPLDKETPQEQLHMVGHESAQKDVDKAIGKLKVGETKTVTIKADVPKDHKHTDDCKHDDMIVRITLKSVKEKILPKLDDSFAKTVGPFEDLAALKKQINEDLSKELDQQKAVDHTMQILEKLRKDHKCALPETMLEQEMQSLRQEFFNRVVQSGQTLGDNFNVENMEKEMKPEAEKRVHEQVILAAIAKAEKFDVSSDEMQGKIQELAQMYNKPAGELYAELQKNNRLESLRSQILSQKTLDFLLTEANIQ